MLEQAPVRIMTANPRREAAVSNMGSPASVLTVAGIDDDVASCGREHMTHIALVNVLFDQVIEDVQRENEVGAKDAMVVDEAQGVIEKEALRRVVCETALALGYRRG
jgi:hypothetical protein